MLLAYPQALFSIKNRVKKRLETVKRERLITATSSGERLKRRLISSKLVNSSRNSQDESHFTLRVKDFEFLNARVKQHSAWSTTARVTI
jgi:hypothetical protein